MENLGKNARTTADLVGNLIARAAARAAPELGDLCDHAHGQNRWRRPTLPM
jgi:hypothetical protein